MITIITLTVTICVITILIIVVLIIGYCYKVTLKNLLPQVEIILAHTPERAGIVITTAIFLNSFVLTPIR